MVIEGEEVLERICFMSTRKKQPIKKTAAHQGVSKGNEGFGFRHVKFEAVMG